MNVLEWSINNFSFWDRNVHQNKIECPAFDFTFCPLMVLYPRGPSGDEDYLVVRIIGLSTSLILLKGQLSFIDSNRSLICMKPISQKKRVEDYYELFPELTFKEVAARIRKNKAFDQLILRCELEWNFDIVYHLYTTIDVYNACVKIDYKIFEESEPSKHIFNMQCPVDDCKRKFLYLSVKLEKRTFSIILKDPKYTNTFIVATEVSVLNNNTLTRTENDRHVFHDCDGWPFLSSLTKKEVTDIGLSILLRIKVIPSNKYTHHCGYFSRHSRAVDIMPGDYTARITSEDDSTTIPQPATALTALCKDLVCLYQDHDFSDFQLRCGEVSFPAHKSLLSVRSPVFKAMLSSGMREATADSVEVTDLDVGTTTRFLQFLYTGTVDDLQWESALKLYYAADKYQVPTLKAECFSVLHKSLSVSSVCDILLLAHNHGDEDLAEEARSFLLENLNEVLRSDKWKSFMETEPLLSVKTITSFAQNNVFRIVQDK